MVGNIMSIRQTQVHYMVYIPTMLEHKSDRDINDFATTEQVQVADNTFPCSWLSISYATVKPFKESSNN